jgi:CheY-like chemotaxis protein
MPLPHAGTILLVDDSADVRQMYAEYLRHVGFQPIEAATSEDAVRIAAAAPPDLVVADLHLPGSMSGIELTRCLRQSAGTRNVPIVMLTGMSRPVDRNVAVSAGANAFLLKPCLPQELVNEIERFLPPRAGQGPRNERPHERD